MYSAAPVESMGAVFIAIIFVNSGYNTIDLQEGTNDESKKNGTNGDGIVKRG